MAHPGRQHCCHSLQRRFEVLCLLTCAVPPSDIIQSEGTTSMRVSCQLHAGSYLEFGGAKKEVSGVRPPVEERVDHVTESMQSSVQNMLIRIESELDAADNKIGQKLHLLVRLQLPPCLPASQHGAYDCR